MATQATTATVNENAMNALQTGNDNRNSRSLQDDKQKASKGVERRRRWQIRGLAWMGPKT
jgi:hypothetical protein